MSRSYTNGIRDYKIVILGDGGVGKSALVMQFVCHRFIEYHDPTIEDSYQKQARIDGEPAKLDILDTAGQPEFNAMHEQYMRNGEGFILCYSITDKRSFDAVLTYKKLIDRVRCKDDIPIILAANKCDLEDRRMVTSEEGMSMSRQLGCSFYETSAVLRQCVDDVFCGLVQEIRRKEKESLEEEAEKSKKGKKKGIFNKLFKPKNLFKRSSHSSSQT